MLVHCSFCLSARVLNSNSNLNSNRFSLSGLSWKRKENRRGKEAQTPALAQPAHPTPFSQQLARFQPTPPHSPDSPTPSPSRARPKFPTRPSRTPLSPLARDRVALPHCAPDPTSQCPQPSPARSAPRARRLPSLPGRPHRSALSPSSAAIRAEPLLHPLASLLCTMDRPQLRRAHQPATPHARPSRSRSPLGITPSRLRAPQIMRSDHGRDPRYPRRARTPRDPESL